MLPGLLSSGWVYGSGILEWVGIVSFRLRLWSGCAAASYVEDVDEGPHLYLYEHDQCSASDLFLPLYFS